MSGVIPLDSVLQHIAAARPHTLDELAAIKGIGPVRLKKYGRAVIALLRDDEKNDNDHENKKNH